MDPAACLDDAPWQLPAAQSNPAIPRAEALSTPRLLDLSRAAAAHDPEAIAATGRSGTLSYRTLLRLTRNVACAVAGRIPPGGMVACIPPRRPESIAALLGCLITGRPCMIIDAAGPMKRQIALLRDAAPVLLLTVKPDTFSHVVAILPLDLAQQSRFGCTARLGET
jgi:non-ribosomal peptide synthetase component F